MVGNRENKKGTVPWNIGGLNWVSLYIGLIPFPHRVNTLST